MDDSAIICDEVIDAKAKLSPKDDDNKPTTNMLKQKTISTNFNEKKATYKTQKFYILLAFLLRPIALLITVKAGANQATFSANIFANILGNVLVRFAIRFPKYGQHRNTFIHFLFSKWQRRKLQHLYCWLWL